MLTIGDHTFTRDEVLAWRADRANPALDENAHAALDFCQRWLAGQEEFIVQTSGSTGAPKPITLTRQQMESSALATAAALAPLSRPRRDGARISLDGIRSSLGRIFQPAPAAPFL